MTILPATSPETIGQVRGLLQTYLDSFLHKPGFKPFGAELAALPGDYAPPRGGLFLGYVDGRPAGCVAFRPWSETQCEAKRLYVLPEHRGRGFGRKLLLYAAEQARALGYREMVGDTLPEVMTAAWSLYGAVGFEQVPHYMPEPIEGAVSIRLKLVE